MANARSNFIVSELWILSWGASVQRGNLFTPEANEEARRAFRLRVIEYLERSILPSYVWPVSDEAHYTNVEAVSRDVTMLDLDSILRDGAYRIGIAQKLLNLHLKYLWCLDRVVEPPHCPIDRVVINKTKLRNQVAWTKMRGINDYRAVIQALREEVAPSGLSLAQWELENYDRGDA